MVVVHVKYGQEDEFLFETTCGESCDSLIRELVRINNRRAQIAFLCGALRDLAKHGPAKPVDDQGCDDLKEKYESAVIEKSPNYEADPGGMRTGNGVGEQLSKVFEDVCLEAERYVSRDQVRARRALTMEALDDKLANMRGAVTMAYPMGLPKWDVVFSALESVRGLSGRTPNPRSSRRPRRSCGARGKSSSETRPSGTASGPRTKRRRWSPSCRNRTRDRPREPVVSEEERKAMMAHYFKRQEELRPSPRPTTTTTSTPLGRPQGPQNSLQGL
ncbi:hypothetical protein CTAYLR_010253 [Chrysophaeum taylorii]|uniref:Uncharacterized protein n=1 Tax=Chrysophaeum taylorii TaxID=2483200 RepID=A0AAD7XPB9_9STRA|nr:hypothetical protein CTAYLR_010253 [Chrysophaeum taylorii]